MKIIFQKKKKRAFTLGAIDGIGDINILKAPLINPENSKVEPPILQLPSATNLIKNIHLKAHDHENIDKSYKYRTQNKNVNVISDMKPLYSLPEKVMTYYMNNNIGEQDIEIEKKNKICTIKENKKNNKIDKEKKTSKDNNEKEQENIIKKNEGVIEHEIYGNKEDIKSEILMTESFKNIKKNVEISNFKKQDKSNNNEKSLDIINRNFDKNEELINCSNGKLINLSKENSQQNKPKHFHNTKDSSDKSGIYKHNWNYHRNNNNNNFLEKLDKTNNKEFQNFELNQIMSSTLTNALKNISGDVF